MKLDDHGNLIWEKNIGDPTIEDYYSEIRPTSDGGVIAVGSEGTDGGGADVIVTKTSKTGNVDWSWVINKGSDSYDLGHSIDKTQDGYVVAGSSYIHQNKDDQLLLVINHTIVAKPLPLYLTDKIWWNWLPINSGHFNLFSCRLMIRDNCERRF
jgi:hypothetical protein